MIETGAPAGPPQEQLTNQEVLEPDASSQNHSPIQEGPEPMDPSPTGLEVADLSDLLQQPEPGQPIRLTTEWAKIIASVFWVWLYSTDQYPTRNQTRVSCKWCKQNSTVLIEITSRAVTPMGQLIAGPYGSRVRLDNGFVGLPINSQPPATTIA